MRKAKILICALAIFAVAGVALAQEAAAPAAAEPVVAAPAAPAVDAETKAKLDKTQVALDAALKRIDDLEAKVNALSGKVGTTSDSVSSLSTQMKGLEAKAKEAPAAAAAPAAPLVKITPYGFLRADVIFDHTATNATDGPAFVNQEKAGFEDKKQFAITARASRIGVDIAGPDIEAGKQTGKIEVDFYGSGPNETKPEPMLRQAYWQLSYPTWNVLVGQSWEPLGPLAPSTINYPSMSYQGNVGHRKPMVRYQRTDKVFGDKTLQADLAMVRTFGSPANEYALDDQGSAAGWPVFEARSGLSFPTSLQRPITVGLSGHFGQEAYDTVTTNGTTALTVTEAANKQFMTYSGCIDWKVPVAANWDIMGEFYGGRNLDAFMGGAAQGVNTEVTQGAKQVNFDASLNKPIDAFGGWAQVCWRPDKKWALNAGVGVDDPENDDLSGALNKTRNLGAFTNAWYFLSDKTKVGVEIMYIKTTYAGGPDGEDMRFQTAVQYNF